MNVKNIVYLFPSSRGWRREMLLDPNQRDKIKFWIYKLQLQCHDETYYQWVIMSSIGIMM